MKKSGSRIVCDLYFYDQKSFLKVDFFSCKKSVWYSSCRDAITNFKDQLAALYSHEIKQQENQAKSLKPLTLNQYYNTLLSFLQETKKAAKTL